METVQVSLTGVEHGIKTMTNERDVRTQKKNRNVKRKDQGIVVGRTRLRT